MKSYTYNPHRHVKIWLGDLPFENQLRLVRMRAINPKDEIHLVYDSNLLVETTPEALKSLADKHEIKLIDVVDLKEEKEITESEGSLLNVYKKEVEGGDGNLGVASDLLRWLTYPLGTYTDFDVTVNTQDLPPEITVEAPMLFSLGSLPAPDYGAESLFLNNDIFAVVDPEAAKDQIEKMQKTLCESFLDKNNPYEKVQKKMKEDIGNYVPKFLLNKTLSMDPTYQNLSTLNLLTRKNKSDYSQKKLRQLIMTKKNNFQLLKTSVITTSGPTALIYNLFGKTIHEEDDFNRDIVPYAFANYKGLGKAFYSKNFIPLKASKKELLEVFSETEVGSRCDISWLQVGVDARKKREAKMEEAAKKIQRTLRMWQKKRAPLEEVGPKAKEDTRELGYKN